jgi:hypothetical protein
VRFYAQVKGNASPWISAEFIKIQNDKDITLANPPARQYSGNGAATLVDGLTGTTDYRVGGWLGFEKSIWKPSLTSAQPDSYPFLYRLSAG